MQQLSQMIKGINGKSYQSQSQLSINKNSLSMMSKSIAHSTSPELKKKQHLSKSSNYQAELLKLMSSNNRASSNPKKEVYLNDVQAQALNNARKLVAESIARMSKNSSQQRKNSPKSSQSPRNGYYLKQKSMTKMTINNLSNSLTTISKRILSNDRKSANISHQVEPAQVTLQLQINGQIHVYKLDANKTTDWLEEYMIDEMRTKFLVGKQNVVGLQTTDKNFPMDFYLQMKGKSLLLFKDQTIQVQPFLMEEDHQHRRIGLKDFKFLKCIGVGGFSRVYLVKKKNNGRIYAMKLIDKEFIIKNRKQGIVQNERDIMTVLDHPFIIKLEHSFESQNFVVFVLEFCSGGELFWQLRQVKRMKEIHARFYFTEICLGMLYLHSLNVVYRDIKPENILIDIDGHVRIADFGLSKPNMSEEDQAYSFCGSPEYMAPEMLLKIGHNVQVDHYCLGALLYELVTGLPPYYSRDTDQIYESILNEELTFPDKLPLSSEIKDLLNGLLTKDTHKRLGYKGGIAQVLTHPWFKGTNLMDILDKKVDPPYKPNQLRFNFDSNELTKGELEAREKLMGRTGLSKDEVLFKSFYFDQNEQHQMKAEQKKIFMQHRNFILQQQAILQARYPPLKKSDSNNSSSASKNNNKSMTSGQLQQLQKRIQQQNVSQPSSKKNTSTQLKRITSQSNFFVDHHFATDTSAMEFSMINKHLPTDQSEPLQKLKIYQFYK